MNLDIHTGVQTVFYLALFGVVLSIFIGIRSIQGGKKLPFFRKRQAMVSRGWRIIFLGLLLGGLAFFFYRFAEPVAYRYFPPSPTITLTPTITVTPSITLTPSASLTPTITLTPSVTNTPGLPEEILSQFSGTPLPDDVAIFSPLVFGLKLDKSNQPVEPSIEFNKPAGKIFGSFSFDKMKNGSQWTALWYLDTKIICVESLVWDGGSGGYGYTECLPEGEIWHTGDYEVRIFVGTTFKSSGKFTALGAEPRATATPTPTLDAALQPTPGVTLPPDPLGITPPATP